MHPSHSQEQKHYKRPLLRQADGKFAEDAAGDSLPRHDQSVKFDQHVWGHTRDHAAVPGARISKIQKEEEKDVKLRN